jgi:phosphate transport system substrate-binding protein
VYILPGCDLRLSRSQLVGAFSGEITDFADLGCTSQTLEVVHRQDASGSTANVNATLAALSDRWRQQVGSGRQVPWPVGLPAKGASELVALVRERPGRISYVESAYLPERPGCGRTAGLRAPAGQGAATGPAGGGSAAALISQGAMANLNVTSPTPN